MENKESVTNSWEIRVLEATYIQSPSLVIRPRSDKIHEELFVTAHEFNLQLYVLSVFHETSSSLKIAV